MLSFSSWKSGGVLLLCGMTPVVIIGIIYFEFTGGYKLKSHFFYNAIAALALAQFIARIGCFFKDAAMEMSVRRIIYGRFGM